MKKTTKNLNENTLKEQPKTFNYIVAQDKFDQLEQLKQDYKNHVEISNTKKSFVNKLQLSLEKFISNIQWADKEKRIPENPHDAKKQKELIAMVELALRELEQAQNDVKQRGDSITELEQELKNYEYNIPALEVVTIQELCKEASKKVESLQCAILDQKEIKEKANSNIPSMQELEKIRENLLAKITLGEADKKDLLSFDKKYVKKHAEMQKAKKNSERIASSANQTIAGLQRRLTIADSELNALKTQRKTVQLHFLRSEIEKAGDEYLELARSLTDKYKRILGLEALMKIFIKKPGIKGINFNDFRIPTFSLRAFNDTHSDYRHGGFYPEARLASKSLTTDKDFERERISKLGVDLG